VPQKNKKIIKQIAAIIKNGVPGRMGSKTPTMLIT